jgi:hypothetical protein
MEWQKLKLRQMGYTKANGTAIDEYQGEWPEYLNQQSCLVLLMY